MSLWDKIAFEENLDTLIAQNPPDYEAILKNNDLLRSYISKDNQNILQFLLDPQHFSQIISTMLTHADRKIANVCAELFVGKNSPMLKKLITEKESSESMIKNIEKGNLVKIGYISRIFQKAAEYHKDDFLSLFNSSLLILSVLTKSIHHTAVLDLLQSFLNLQQPEDQWIIFSYLQILLPKGKAATCPKCFLKYKDSIIGLIKQIQPSQLTLSQKSNMIKLLMETNKANKGNEQKNNKFNKEIINAVAPCLAPIYEANEDKEFRTLILTFASTLKPEKDLLNISAKLILRSTSYDNLAIAALNLLTLSPSKTLVSLMPKIVNSFVSDKTNTFHHMSFVNFIKSTLKIPELKQDILSRLPPLIIENASASKWRTNASQVSFYLEIADILDSLIEKPNSPWLSFRNNELTKWRAKNEVVEVPKPVATSSDQPKKPLIDEEIPNTIQTNSTPNNSSSHSTNIAAQNTVAIAATGISRGEVKTDSEQSSFNFPPVNSFPSFEENKEEEKPNFNFPDANAFPSFGENQEEKPNFNFPEMNSFPDFNNTPGNEDEKVTFPDPEQENAEDKPVFGFPADSAGFGSFPDMPEAASFPPIQNQQPEKVEFTTPQEPTQIKPQKQLQMQTQQEQTSGDDTSFDHFMALVNNPCWEYSGPSPEELFGQKDRFTSAEEAFTCLLNQS
ncbi:hypothetical protein TRFO_18751 [Tritrichomonas foetus]|uniref:Uncharacterized protein n=1 Tax=Tritrichomonas foetus TaxID=1144522 RepID=A0A1J4KKK5_9EUKA|nr:hypothetical protein TRFO_18751 [Tritrichomonas foetus]|eukprot:OHT11763.1 hypothetical protein TRFO_18751 [Tritrichomonas foetus]